MTQTHYDHETLAQLSQRYLHGKLNEEDTSSFEAYIIANPDVVEQLELDAALISGLKAYKRPLFSRVSHRLSEWLSPPTLVASACTFVLGVVVTNLLSSTAPVSPIQGVSNVVYLDTLRSFEPQQTTITIAKDNQHEFVFFLQTGPKQMGPFEVALWQDETNQAQLHLPFAPLSNTGEVIVTVPAKVLQSGNYTLDVTDVSSQAKTSTQFTVVREP